MKQEIVYKELSYKINGLMFKVHNELGRYCNEKQCCDLLEQKLLEEKMDYEREVFLPKSFKGENQNRNKADFVIENKIIIEVKNKRFIEKNDFYQVKRYLIASNKKLGILVNFRDKHLKPKRILNSQFED